MIPSRYMDCTGAAYGPFNDKRLAMRLVNCS